MSSPAPLSLRRLIPNEVPWPPHGNRKAPRPSDTSGVLDEPIKKAIPAAHVAPVFVFLFHRSMSRRPRMGTTPRWPVVLGSDAGIMLGPVATNGECLCSVKVIRVITTTIAARIAMMSPLPQWRGLVLVYCVNQRAILTSRIASPGMLLNKFPPMTGGGVTEWVGVVDGGKDQHGRAARGGVGGGGALPADQAGGEGAHPRELCATTGWHRKHAVRALRQRETVMPGAVGASRERRRRYGATIKDALTALWEASDRVCGKRLKVMIPTLLPALEQHGRLTLDEAGSCSVFSPSALQPSTACSAM